MTSAGFEGSYSAIADLQLDELELGTNHLLFNGALDACELIFRAPRLAQSKSSAINTADGIRFRLPIVGHPPFKVFWQHTDSGPRIEAIFPHA